MTALISTGADLRSIWLITLLPPGDPDNDRDLAGQIINWLLLAGVISIAGLLFMGSTWRSVSATLRARHGWQMGIQWLRLGFILGHLSPWIHIVVRVSMILKR
jgi:hypothetical protein